MINYGNYEQYARIKAIHVLRVNVKSLAHEAKVIRHECGNIPKIDVAPWMEQATIRSVLTFHRTTHLRQESRSAQLALAAVRGTVPYSRIEEKCKSLPDWNRVEAKIRKASSTNLSSAEKWVKTAIEYLSKSVSLETK